MSDISSWTILLPCPGCTVNRVDWETDDGKRHLRVACACGFVGLWVEIAHGLRTAVVESVAVTAWNALIEEEA